MKARLLRRSHAFYAMGVIAGLALLAASRGGAQAEIAPRYPFDPLCPWGRISDGHGMIVRCLGAAEATALAREPQASALPSEPAPASTVAPVPSAAAPSAPVASVPAPVPAQPLAPPPVAPSATFAPAAVPHPSPAPAAPVRAQNAAVSQIGPLAVDTGDLPSALAELRKPKQRYTDCVNQNGGLTGAHGRVQVRFLVRELGRAEGVLVKEREGVSLEAAKCIAGVIDRRNVGYPEAPIVGATIAIDLEPARGR
jgi:hypothetical protein